MRKLRCSNGTKLNKAALILAILFLCMVLFPSHKGIPESERMHSHPAAANPSKQFYNYILPITTLNFESGSAMISFQVKNNFHKSNNNWLNALFFINILLYCSYMAIWFFNNDKPVPTAFDHSSEISLRIGGHAPPIYI